MAHDRKVQLAHKESSRQLQNNLYQTAKKDKKRVFHALYDRIYRLDILHEAWRKVKANKGTPGIDGKSIADIDAKGITEYLERLSLELKEGEYHAQSVRRVYIPKADGRKRPLGIPTIKDRIVQQACKMILEPIFEANFLECSHGYRPRHSAQKAVLTVSKSLIRGWAVVDGDIKGFFDNMNHELLLRILQKRIADKRVLKLIREWLEAPVSEKAVPSKSNEKGTPQGGVISPLLSNIYLHVMDKYWEENCSHLGQFVRYADDFVIICRDVAIANQAMDAIRHILNRLELELHPEKTKVVYLGKGDSFTFLGFAFQKWKNRKSGKLLPYHNPIKRKVQEMKSKLREQTRAGLAKLPLAELVRRLNPVIRGYWQYFRHGNSTRVFQHLDLYTFQRFRIHFFRRFSPKVKERGLKFKTWFENCGIRKFYYAKSLRLSLSQCC